MLTSHSFIGAAIRKRSFVSAYAQALWYMVGFQLGSGAFFIYTLYRQKEVNIQKCITELQAQNVTSVDNLRSACEIATTAWKVGYIVTFVITLLLHGCESVYHLYLALY
jgi:hypothetical protein